MQRFLYGTTKHSEYVAMVIPYSADQVFCPGKRKPAYPSCKLSNRVRQRIMQTCIGICPKLMFEPWTKKSFEGAPRIHPDPLQSMRAQGCH